MPDSRGKILDAAEELFATKGYERTTTREVAELAGVSAPLIAHHFAGKAELLRAVAVRIIEWADDRRAVVRKQHEDEPLEQRVRAMTELVFEHTCIRPAGTRIYATLTYSDELWDQVGMTELMWGGAATEYGPLVQEYLEAYPDKDVAAVVTMVAGVVTACMGRVLIGADVPPPPEGLTEREAAQRWCKRMTDNAMKVLFGT